MLKIKYLLVRLYTTWKMFFCYNKEKVLV